MQAIILAGGRGKRLNSEKPKCLTQVLNKPILEYTLENIYDFIDEIIIVIGFKGEEVKKYFGDKFKDKKIIYVLQKEQLGTAHALLQTKEFIEDKFILLMGDDFYSKEDVEKCVNNDLAALAIEVEDPSNFGVFLLNNGFIDNIVEKPKYFISNLVSVGLYVLDRRIFDEINEIEKSQRGEYELTSVVLELAKKNKIKCEKVTGLWFPVNKVEDVKFGEKQLARFLKT